MSGTRLPRVVYVLAAGTFMLGTTEFMIAGLLPEVSAAMHVSVARGGLLITVFALGMIVGSPVIALATRRLPKRSTLMAALAVFAAGHVIAALAADFAVLLAARFLTALATGAFWSLAAVVATRAAVLGDRRPLGTALHQAGPPAVGTVISAMTLLPLAGLALLSTHTRRTAPDADCVEPAARRARRDCRLDPQPHPGGA